MHKRIISMVLILALLPACLAVPALADQDDSWHNVLDYGFLNNTQSNYYALTYSTELDMKYSSFYFPYAKEIEAVDIIFKTDAENPLLQLSDGYLTVIPLGDDLYRAFGNGSTLSPSVEEVMFGFRYSKATYYEIVKFDVFFSTISTYPVDAHGAGYAYKYPTNQSLVISGTNSSVIWTYSSYEEWDLYRGSFSLWFDVDDWQAYDFVDVQVSLAVADITSLSASIGNFNVPCEINFIMDDTSYGFFLVSARLDLRGLDRTSSNPVSLLIQGNGIYDADGGQRNIVTLRTAYGSVIIEEPSLWTYWFKNVQNWLSSGFSSVVNGLVAHQNALIDAQKLQHEADRQLWNTISSNVGTWISNQTSAITNSLSTINSSVTTFCTNVETWFTNQTNSITSSISSWGQSLKDSIDALPDKIAEALKDLVVPEDGAIESMATKSEELVSDRFGGVFEGAQIVDNWASQLESQAATQILTIPVVNMNILGKIFPIGGWEVDLVPDGFEVIFESVKLIIDILATAAFINGIKSRLERTLEK